MHELTDEEFLSWVEYAILTGNLLLGYRPRWWKKLDGTPVSEADLQSQTHLMQSLRRLRPNLHVLSEELLPHVIPPDGEMYVSIDSLDGTAYHQRGFAVWSVSQGMMLHTPIAGVVVQPALRRAFVARRGRGVMRCGCRIPIRFEPFAAAKECKDSIGTDFNPDPLGESLLQYESEVKRVLRCFGCRSQNMPAVHAGIEVMSGNIRFWWSHTAHHWDLAATALMLEEVGGIAECLDGSPIPWDVIKLPPVILAASRKDADEVRKVLCSTQ